MGAIRLGLLNYADVRNFGDVLFPLVVSRELRVRIPDAIVEFITPTGTSWAGMSSHRFDKVDLNSFDALILGGGEIVHRGDDMLKNIYRLFGLECIDRPTDLVFRWTDASASFKAWLSVGVPEPSEMARKDISRSLAQLDFVAARGSSSFLRLKSCQAPEHLKVLPDLGWLFPRLIKDFRAIQRLPDGPYLVIQALNFPNIRDIAASIQRAAKRHALRVVLLPLTRCWQDVQPLAEICDASDNEFILVDDSIEDVEKLTILGGASCYVGQSMHGLIGTLSQGRMGGICFPEKNDKFQELLRDANLLPLRVPTWEGVEALIESLLWTPPALVARYRSDAVKQLDRAFDQISAAISATRR